MKYYKTFEDALTSAFEEKGLNDDNGNPIKATGKPMTEEEFIAHKKEVITEKVNRLTHDR